MISSQSLALFLNNSHQPSVRPPCRRSRRGGCVARFIVLVLAASARPTIAQPTSTVDTPGAVIGVYKSGSKTVTASCSGNSGQYTTWDGTVGCRWLFTPSVGPVATSLSRGLSCLPTPQASSKSQLSSMTAPVATVAAVSLAQGDSVHLFTSMTTRYVTCGGAGCGTVRIWDYRDGATPVAGMGGVLVTCLDDLGLTWGTEMAVFYRNGGDMVGNSSADGNSNGSNTVTGSSPSSQPTSAARISSGAIAGITIGALLALILTSTIFLLSIRRRRRHQCLFTEPAIAEPKPSTEPPEKASFCRRISSRYRPEKTSFKSPPSAPAPATSAITSKSPNTEPPLSPHDGSVPAELDSQIGVPWALWRQIKSSDVPREMPVDEGCAELLGCEAQPCELDAAPVPASSSARETDEKARPSAADKAKTRVVAAGRSAEHELQIAAEQDEAPPHPYNFYSPWTVGEQLAEEDRCYESRRRQDTRCPGDSAGSEEKSQ